MAGNAADRRRTVVSRIAAIVRPLEHGHEYSLTEIARMSGLPVSTAHRLIGELTAWRLLERTRSQRYRVGIALRGPTPEVGPSDDALEQLGALVVDDLATATNAKVRLGRLTNLQILYIEKASRLDPVSHFAGDAALPVHATAMGKMILALSPPRQVDAVVAAGLRRFTDFTVTTSADLHRQLRQARVGQMALCRRELDPRVSEIAAPVLGRDGHVVGALQVEVGHVGLPALRPALTVAAKSLSRALCGAGAASYTGWNPRSTDTRAAACLTSTTSRAV